MLPSEASQGTGHLVALMRPCFVTKRGWESFYYDSDQNSGACPGITQGLGRGSPPRQGRWADWLLETHIRPDLSM